MPISISFGVSDWGFSSVVYIGSHLWMSDTLRPPPTHIHTPLLKRLLSPGLFY